MAYNFNASDLKQLYGQHFKLPSSSGGEVFNAYLRPPAPGWPRSGAEAYCTLLEVQRSNSGTMIPSVLKIFMKDLQHRNQRSTFLVKTAFAKEFDWLFQGVPFSALNGVDIGGRLIYAHLTKQIGAEYGLLAEDFGRLKETGRYEGFDAALRRRFAGHLAVAVRVLERFDFVHGDLSESNVMIGPGPAPSGPVLCLCDFDGFRNPRMPLLPRRQRPLGSPGYQPPFFIDAVEADPAFADEGLSVASDRFALAVLACELMVWSDEVERRLGGRTQLLDDVAVRSRGLGALDRRIPALWPEGFALLEKALDAKSWAELPAPEAWLELLGVKTYLRALPFRDRPFLTCRPARLDSARETRRAEISKPAGSLGPVHVDLASLSYTFVDKRLTLSVPAGTTILEGSLDGGGLNSHLGPASLSVGPRALIAFNGWRIEIHDERPATPA